MGSMMRRLRQRTGWRAPLRRVAFDFESFGRGRHDRGPHFGLGKTRITADPHYGYREELEGHWQLGPDLVLRDETDWIMDRMAQLLLPWQKTTVAEGTMLAIGGDFAHTERTILAIDPGSPDGGETGVVYFKGGKVVR